MCSCADHIVESGLFDPHNENLITQVGAQNNFDWNEYHVLTPSGTYYEHDGSYTFAGFQARTEETHGSESSI